MDIVLNFTERKERMAAGRFHENPHGWLSGNERGDRTWKKEWRERAGMSGNAGYRELPPI